MHVTADFRDPCATRYLEASVVEPGEPFRRCAFDMRARVFATGSSHGAGSMTVHADIKSSPRAAKTIFLVVFSDRQRAERVEPLHADLRRADETMRRTEAERTLG